MSEQQVLPKTEGTMDAMCETILKLGDKLARSEAERERLQGELAQSHDVFKATFAIATNLRDELARERELNQGLRHINDTLTGVIAIQVEKIAKLQLEDKAKPVAD